MTTTTIFFISMIGLLMMVFWKVFEIKVKKINFLSNIFTRGDERIHDFINLIVLRYLRLKKIVNIFIFDFLPLYLYELLGKTKDYASKKYYKIGDKFRGERILKSTGSVSFFLERLSEDKNQ